jgi:hypothetical protein
MEEECTKSFTGNIRRIIIPLGRFARRRKDEKRYVIEK